VRNGSICAHKGPQNLSGIQRQFLFVVATSLSLQGNRGSSLHARYFTGRLLGAAFWGMLGFFLAAGD